MKTHKLLTIFFLTLATSIAGNFTNVVANDAIDDELEEAADLYNKNKSNIKYKVVCKREAPVGTRIKRNVCRTVAMIDSSQRNAQEMLDRMRTSIGPQ